MLTYITAFIFYTLAMIGILLIGFVVYKKTMVNTKGENKGFIKVIDSLAIAPKKMLLVVKIKNEKFLIASGAEHTTFLAKLSDEEVSKKKVAQVSSEIEEKSDEISPFAFFEKQNIDFGEIQKERNLQIQKQFKELYEKEMLKDIQEKQESKIPALNKKELLKQLLKNLDVDSPKAGSKF